MKFVPITLVVLGVAFLGGGGLIWDWRYANQVYLVAGGALVLLMLGSMTYVAAMIALG